MSVVYVDTGETEDKNKINECRDHVCMWMLAVLPPSHALLCHPAVESTSFVNFSPGLLKAHSGEIQMLFFCLFVLLFFFCFRLKIVLRRADMIIFESHYTPFTLSLVLTESED